MNKLVFVILFSIVLKPVFPLLDYAFNYKYISTVLCVNKDKPKLNCCGKCHLKKELAKAADETPNNSEKKNNVKFETEVLFFEKIPTIDFKFKYYFDKFILLDYYNNLYCYSTNYYILRPPISI